MSQSRGPRRRFRNPEDGSRDAEAAAQPQGRQANPQPPASRDGASDPTAAPCPVPATPGELIAMQQTRESALTGPGQARVEEALAQIHASDLNAWESQQIALALLQQLETYHAQVVAELHEENRGTPAQVACWAIDGDRLMHCRRLLESITLI